ncbi:MAG TPA: carbohydrate kinase, partial [Planctomycetaceae bacterium]|nr:carbohydrate kinase [Planctomycetaceae bacterium]
KTLYAIGIIGTDGEGFDLREALVRVGCSTERLTESDAVRTPTYLKPRDVTDPTLAGEHNRYDTKNRQPTPDPLIEQVLNALDRLLPHLDALIISDQVEEDDCGVVTAHVRAALAERAAEWPNVLFWADSRRRIRLFRNVTIKPNQFEAVGQTVQTPDAEIDLETLQRALPALRQAADAPVFLTLAARGMLVSDPEPTHVPTVRLEGPTDPTGAGDSATAGCVLALTSGASPAEAALVGNLVASITVQQLATTGTASPDQLVDRLTLWRREHPDIAL